MLEKISGTLNTQIFFGNDPEVIEMAFDFIFFLLFLCCGYKNTPFSGKKQGIFQSFSQL